MKCPVCKSVNLVMSDKKGVEIDYCPECRGVWLDRGELDKIIERTNDYSQQNTAPANNVPTQDHQQNQQQRNQNFKNDNRSHEKTSKKSRMSDLLGDLFDF
jgi:Zn-finger nucleic acid-binding protein